MTAEASKAVGSQINVLTLELKTNYDPFYSRFPEPIEISGCKATCLVPIQPHPQRFFDRSKVTERPRLLWTEPKASRVRQNSWKRF